MNQIHDLDQKFNIGSELVDKLQSYFEQNVATMDTSSSMDMDYLLTILPASIKIELTKFLHKGNIHIIDFLKNRPDSFYLNYLEKFRPVRFEKGDLIFERGKKPREIYMSFNGRIIN